VHVKLKKKKKSFFFISWRACEVPSDGWGWDSWTSSILQNFTQLKEK